VDGVGGVLLVAGAVGAIAFLVVSTVDGLTRPGYSVVRHPVSALALGPRGWLQTWVFVVCGALVAAGGVGLWPTSWLLAAGVLLLGLGLVVSGVYPMDPMRGYPPGTPEGDPAELTTSHVRHDQAGAVVFFSMPVLPVVAAATPALPAGLPWASVAVAVAVGVGVAAFSRAWEVDAPLTGLVQRLTLLGGLGWLAALLLVVAVGA